MRVIYVHRHRCTRVMLTCDIFWSCFPLPPYITGIALVLSILCDEGLYSRSHLHPQSVAFELSVTQVLGTQAEPNHLQPQCNTNSLWPTSQYSCCIFGPFQLTYLLSYFNVRVLLSFGYQSFTGEVSCKKLSPKKKLQLHQHLSVNEDFNQTNRALFFLLCINFEYYTSPSQRFCRVFSP